MVKCKMLPVLLFIIANIYAQNNTGEMLITYISNPPSFNGDLKTFVVNNINYPKSALIDSIEGRVVVAFMIDTTGCTFDHRVIRGIRDDLDQEALRVARLIKFDTPAMQKDKAIKINYTIPVDFCLKYSHEIVNKDSECFRYLYEQYLKIMEVNVGVVFWSKPPLLYKISEKHVDSLCKFMNELLLKSLNHLTVWILIDSKGVPSCVSIDPDVHIDKMNCEYVVDIIMNMRFMPAEINGNGVEGFYGLILRQKDGKWFAPKIAYVGN